MYIKEQRHLLLLISILALFTLTPLLISLRYGVLLLNSIAAVVLISGSFALSRSRSLFVIAIILSILSVVTTWLLSSYPGHASVLIWHSCLLSLMAFFAFAVLRYVLQAGGVTADKIFAAICVYMLIGYAWTFAYALVDQIDPDAFRVSAEVARTDFFGRVAELRYFSFITLTTLGYGDVVPRSPMARTLASIEAVMGQLYLAVLVARLVGLHIVHQTTHDDTA